MLTGVLVVEVKLRINIPLGAKVIVNGLEQLGFGEVSSYPDDSGSIEVSYFSDAIHANIKKVPINTLRRDLTIPLQTRCYVRTASGFEAGLLHSDIEQASLSQSNIRNYVIRLTNQRLVEIPEDEFHVRANLQVANPVALLKSFSHETPLYFEWRNAWIREYLNQLSLCGGMTALMSSSVDFFPHQIEVIRRVLNDPEMRYLLADEVGLGKTIEAGVILRQIKLDWPTAKVACFVPIELVDQWQGELFDRLKLSGIDVLPHSELHHYHSKNIDVLLVDEAHLVVSDATSSLFNSVCRLARATRHMLLLSATPILHHEEEFLALLHLLSPDAYPLDNKELFKRQVSVRNEVGRVLLGLRAASRPTFLRRRFEEMIRALPDDAFVVESCTRIPDDADVSDLHALADKLIVHVTETYRLHQRMLRNRRSLLVDQGEALASRRLTTIEYELDDRLGSLWSQLEDWRIAAAAEIAEDARWYWIDLYWQLATALSADRSWLEQILANRIRGECENWEKPLLTQMMTLCSEPTEDGDRIELLCELIQNLRESTRGKHVVFCSFPELCERIVKRLNKLDLGKYTAQVHSMLTAEMRSREIERFRYDPECRFLLADGILEHGCNMQFAESVTFFDLPTDPSRIEQRVGRLDRIDRSGDVVCRVILTVEDESLALDTVWHSLMNEGLGIWNRSISDLQFLIERDIAAFRELAFEGGPSAVISAIPKLKETVAEERKHQAEQDVLDGLSIRSIDSEIFHNLERAESRHNAFMKAFLNYGRNLLNLPIQGSQENHEVFFNTLRGVPRLPIEYVRPLRIYNACKFTTSRARAMQRHDTHLLRVGHPLVEHIWKLADWDDRGRAFALWRVSSGIGREAQVVFRFVVRTSVAIGTNNELPGSQNLDPIVSAALHRMVGGWLPEQIHEMLLTPSGTQPPENIQEICNLPYDKTRDTNLDGPLSTVLTDVIGRSTWAALCDEVAEHALTQVARSAELTSAQSQARQRAEEYFLTTLCRFENRHKRCMERGIALDDLISREVNLQCTVNQMIDHPRLQIDAIGVYILSSCPVNSREH